jgi:2-phospho-L-lactate guanylyltransferase
MRPMPATPTDASSDRFAVLVPVKPPAFAKSRLRDLGDQARRDLATAFAVDTVTAAAACPVVAAVLVVTDDHELARGLADLGVEVIPDGTTDDLNVTLRLAAAEMARRRPELHLVALCADLPALRPDELTAALSAAHGTGMAFVADADGVGTTAVIAPDLDSFSPAFGTGSRQRHLDAGAHEVDGIDVPSLRRDVDDREALTEAVRLGVGPHTSMVVTTLGLAAGE